MKSGNGRKTQRNNNEPVSIFMYIVVGESCARDPNTNCTYQKSVLKYTNFAMPPLRCNGHVWPMCEVTPRTNTSNFPTPPSQMLTLIGGLCETLSGNCVPADDAKPPFWYSTRVENMIYAKNEIKFIFSKVSGRLSTPVQYFIFKHSRNVQNFIL